MRWIDSLDSQIRTLLHTRELLDHGEVNKVIRLLADCKGLRYFTGVGKNGHVASKLASTFSSLGLRSIFIDPVHALHGDMSLFEEEDILIAISKSGSTEELVTFVQALKNRKFANIIAIHSNRGSTLDLHSIASLYVPILSEGDHLELAPVGSSAVYMCVLQSFAVQISSNMGFSKSDFVRTHPGGALGKVDVPSATVKHVIIQAGGKGTRLRKHTLNKPKCLVSIDGKPLLYHVFELFPEAEFYVIGDYHFDILKQYLTTFPPKQKVKLIRAVGTGTCAGIEQARQLLPDQATAFALLWSDLYLLQEVNVPDGKTNYIGLTNAFRCRWSWNNGAAVEDASDTRGISGFFYFGLPEGLPTVPHSGEFVRFLHEKKVPFEPLYLPPTCKEIGTLDALEKHLEGKAISRFFNRITMYDNKVIKEPVVEEYKGLLEKELHWYHEVRRLGFTHIPNIYETSPFTIEKINGYHPFELEMDYKSKEIVLKNIINKLNTLHSLRKQTYNERDMELEYIEKTLTRFEKIRGMFSNLFLDEYIVNGKPTPNYLHPKHAHKMNEAFQLLPRSPFTVIHGDPTFSNILIDEQFEPWFIDPRGYFGSQLIYGDPNYDFYKLYYSLKGNYDLFNRKHFSLKINGNHIDLDLPVSSWHTLEPLFYEMTALDQRCVNVAVGFIWLSLAGYSVDDIDSIYGAFFKGLEFLHHGLPN